MLIVCPSCASEYMIDPERLGAEGRTVRCASCKATWFVAPEAETPPASYDSLAAEETTDNRARPPAFDEPAPAAQAAAERDAWIKAAEIGRGDVGGRRGAARLRAIAGTLFVLAVLVAFGAALWNRAQVVRAFPRTAALYAGIGLPVNLRGLEFRNVRSERAGTGADAVLVVEGEIANISGRDASVPPIEIGLRGGEGQMLYTWTDSSPRQALGAKDVTYFRARLAAPPAEAREVLVRFPPAQDGAAAVASQSR